MTASLYLGQQRTVPMWQEPVRTGSQEISPESEEWIAQARCRQNDPDALFVQGAEQRRAAALCRPCPVRQPCLATALDNREDFGVWGGLTERQRRALLRKNPRIDNWADHLAADGEIIGI